MYNLTIFSELFRQDFLPKFLGINLLTRWLEEFQTEEIKN